MNSSRLLGVESRFSTEWLLANVSPKRISGLLTVSRQLLVQQPRPEFDRILINYL